MRLTNIGYRTKSIITLDGVVELRRTMLIPADKESEEKLLELDGRTGLFPLDELIGIDKIPFKATYQAMAMIAKEGIRCGSYREAASILNDYHHYDISPAQVKRITDYVCSLVYDDDCKKAEHAKSFEGAHIDRRKCRKDVLYLEFDGSYYLENIMDAPGCDWKECKIAIAFCQSDIVKWGNDTAEIKKKDYAGYIGSADEFKYHLIALAERNGLFSCKEIVVITDGAKWILPLIREIFPQATPILDLFHAKENAGKFAKAVIKGKKKQQVYADKLCELIDKGEVDELLRILEPYKNFKREGVVNFYSYVDRLKDCMHYDQYIEKGYLVGSGHIESSHRYVMQDRMKRPGQHWNREHGQGILSAKCRYESDNWSSVIELIRVDYDRLRNEIRIGEESNP